MFAGGTLLIRHYTWTTAHRLSLLAFAAGSLLSLSFAEFLPEAFHEDASVASLTLIVTFSAFFVLDIVFHPHFDEDTAVSAHISVWWILVGWWLHSFFDGLALAIAFSSSVGTGILVTIGIMMHKILDGVNAVSLLISFRVPHNRLNALLFLLSIATPVGTVLYTLLRLPDSPVLLAVRFGFLSALFIYIAAADILPQFHEKRETTNLLAFLLGMGVFTAFRFLLPE